MNNPISIPVPASPDQSAILAGFTTRRGGVSLPPFDSLNLGTGTTDDPASVRENYRILYRSLGLTEDRVALMRQVHGDTVRIINGGGVSDDTDGLLTTIPGLLLGVRVADCVPVLLHDPRKKVVGAIHCGWKPTVAGILERAIEMMCSEWGAIPETVHAVLGPSARACCYEVGPEVAARLRPGSVRDGNGKLRADLHAEAAGRLVDAGLRRENIESIARCTICEPETFFSHRRDGLRSGRMMGYIMLKREG